MRTPSTGSASPISEIFFMSYMRKVRLSSHKFLSIPAGTNVDIVLPHNRFGSADFVFAIGVMLFHYLAVEPRGPVNEPKVAIAPELHELVREKMLAQDSKFREMLQSIRWIIED